LCYSLISTDTPGGSGDEAEESKGTELTTDNYAQYINLDIKASAGDPLFTCPDGVRISESYMATMLYGSVFVNMTVSGASTNFNYNDVTIKVKATVTYRTDTYKNYFADIMESKETQEFDLEAKTNISGNCDVIVAYYELPEGYYTHDYLISVDYEMVEVTGTVTPA
jgi:hypothetical protein